MANEAGLPKDVTSGTYALSDNIELKSPYTLPAGVKLYTKGFAITADSTNTLTVAGELYINGTNGAVILENGTSNIATRDDGVIVIDTDP